MKRHKLKLIAPESGEEGQDQMKVTMVACMAGPNGVAKPGTVLDVPADKAKELLDGRYAREYDAERDRKNQQGLQRAPEAFER